MRRSGFESSYSGAAGGNGGYANYNSSGGYGGYPSQAAAAGYNYNSGGYGGYPSQAAAAAGYPPVAYPPPSGYPAHLHSAGGGLAGAATGHMMPPPHGHGHAHGGYVAHGGSYGGHGYGYGGHHTAGNGKFKHGKFGNHGGFKNWK